MKLRYPKTREEFNELVAYLQAKTPILVNPYNSARWVKDRKAALFSTWPIEVQVLAKANLANLLIKYKDKLEAKPYGKRRNIHFAGLVGIATMMATRKLGLAKTSWSEAGRRGFNGYINKSKARTFIGLQEPLIGKGREASYRRKMAAQNYNPNPSTGQVNQGDLTGV